MNAVRYWLSGCTKPWRYTLPWSRRVCHSLPPRLSIADWILGNGCLSGRVLEFSCLKLTHRKITVAFPDCNNWWWVWGCWVHHDPLTIQQILNVKLHLTEQRTGNTSVCPLFRLFVFQLYLNLQLWATTNIAVILGERVNSFHQNCQCLFLLFWC